MPWNVAAELKSSKLAGMLVDYTLMADVIRRQYDAEVKVKGKTPKARRKA